jgi:hypothetical protein
VQNNERSLPIYCPTCGHPVALVLDLGIPVRSPQNWNCPRCGALHLASFEARVKSVTPRQPVQPK